MPRNRLGQFTARRGIGAADLARRQVGRFEPITGTEVDGVVSGETIVLGAEPPPEPPEVPGTTRAKARA